MGQIHPTAIVDERAKLADDVIVGPWCLIEGDVELGPGCVLYERVSLRGPLKVGPGNRFYPHAVIGLEPQDRNVNPSGHGIVIGEGNWFREGVTIHPSTSDHPTAVGDRNYLMANSHLAHDVRIGNDCNFANGVLLAGHAHVADRVTLGGNAVVHQFARIGRLSMMSGVAGIVKDLPPFCTVYRTRVVSSLNIVGLRRAGLREHIRPLKKAFEILFMSRHTNARAVERIETELGDHPLCVELAAFVRASTRGILVYGSGTSPDGPGD